MCSITARKHVQVNITSRTHVQVNITARIHVQVNITSRTHVQVNTNVTNYMIDNRTITSVRNIFTRRYKRCHYNDIPTTYSRYIINNGIHITRQTIDK